MLCGFLLCAFAATSAPLNCMGGGEMNTIRSGRIYGDPTKGLCERVCIEVSRVYDGCREQVSSQSFLLTLTDIPPTAVLPFTYVRAVSFGESTFTVNSITDGSGERSNVSGTVTIPLLVTFTDAGGGAFTAKSSYSFTHTFSLYLPQDAITPYTFGVSAAFRSTSGQFVSDNIVSVLGSAVLIAKVKVNVDLLVPSYGYAVYPDCSGACGRDSDTPFVDLPLFP